MPLTPIAIRCLNKNIKELHKCGDEMAEMGIYVFVDEDDITKMYALLIGSEGTPYEGGFFFFEIRVPDNYPMKPPQVKFLSTAHNVRIHPNLYTEGKVCLSIINTWMGDGWSSVYTIKTMLLAMKSYVFVEHPLHNEPGYEDSSNESTGTVGIYTRYVTYQSIRTCVNNMLVNLPLKLRMFREIMNDNLRKNIDSYYKRLTELIKTNNTEIIKESPYSMAGPCITNYEKEYEIFKNYCDKLGITSEYDTYVKTSVETETEPTKKSAGIKMKVAKTKTKSIVVKSKGVKSKGVKSKAVKSKAVKTVKAKKVKTEVEKTEVKKTEI